MSGTTRTWIGNADGNNNASNPDNWNPNGTPQPGDTLMMPEGTIDIRDNDLASDTLVIPLEPSAGVVSINLEKGTDTLNWEAGIDRHASITLLNNATMTTRGSAGGYYASNVTISGGHRSEWINDGTVGLPGGQLVVDTNVTGSGTFLLTLGGETAVQNAGGSLEFAGSVSAGQTVDATGALVNQRGAYVVDTPALSLTNRQSLKALLLSTTIAWRIL